jgi:hypothetical protein
MKFKLNLLILTNIISSYKTDGPTNKVKPICHYNLNDGSCLLKPMVNPERNTRKIVLFMCSALSAEY